MNDLLLAISVTISAAVAVLLFVHWNKTGRSWPFWVFCAVMGTVNWYLRNYG